MKYALIDAASGRVLQFQDHEQFSYSEPMEGQQLVKSSEHDLEVPGAGIWYVKGQFTTEEPAAAPAPPAPPPRVVSRRQGRRALLAAGLLDKVEAALNTLPSPKREEAWIDWEDAAQFERDSDLVKNLASALGLEEGDLDQLFALAATK